MHRFRFFIILLFISFGVFSLASCELFFEKMFGGSSSNTEQTAPAITAFQVSPGSGKAIISYTVRGTNGTVTITGTNAAGKSVYIGNSYEYRKKITGNTSETIIVENLTNDEEYTFQILYDYEYNDQSLGIKKTQTVIPSVMCEMVCSYSDYKTRPIILEPETSVVTISGLDSEKFVAMVNRNTTNSVIPKDYIRSLVEIKTNSRSATGSFQDEIYIEDMPVMDFGDTVTYVHKTLEECKVSGNAPGRSVIQSPAKSVTWTDSGLVVGSTSQYLWLDNDTSLSYSSLAQKSVTLQAKGYDGNGKLVCCVWVEDNCFRKSGNSTGKYVNRTMAGNIANKFVEFYYQERALAGQECSELFIDSTGGITQVGESPSGDIVNIVVYDIASDYTADSKTGIVGYFWAKDYMDPQYSAYEKSNGGKYFYVDAPYCNKDATILSSWLNRPSQTVVATLFHEFQHMINFNQKNILAKISRVGGWYNEMLSMLVEDAMGDMLDLEPDDRVYGTRIPGFNRAYYQGGFKDDEVDSAVSYSTIYAFGGWLARNYGGIDLIHRMCTNKSVDMESILEAVEYCGYSGMTEEKLFREFVDSVIYRTSYVKNNGDFAKTSYNCGKQTKDIDMEAGLGQATFTLNPYDIFSEEMGYQTTGSSVFAYGPLITTSDNTIDLKAGHGLMFRKIETGTADTVTLIFSNHNKGDEVSIYIQDKFSQRTPD